MGSGVKFLKDLIAIFDAPRRIVTDQDTDSTGGKVKAFFKKADIEHVLNATASRTRQLNHYFSNRQFLYASDEKD